MTDKKFFDIIPPEELDNQEILIEPGQKKHEQRETSVKAKKVKKETPFSFPGKVSYKKPLILILVCLVLGGGIAAWFLYLPKVKVEILLATKSLDFEGAISTDKSLVSLDLNQKTLPGKLIAEQASLSGDFTATGKVLQEKKTEGTVTIYNNFSQTSQPLVATTRFVSADGKLFRLKERTVVPGQTTVGGKTEPGSIEAKVVADAAGPEYNISASTFSIPGFAGTAKYTAIWAKSFSPMTGGFKGEVTAVSSQDLEKAKLAARLQIEEKVDNLLNNEVPSGFVLAQKASALAVLQESSSAQAGDAGESFSYQIKAKKQAVLLSENDLRQISKFFLEPNLEQDQKLLTSSLKIAPVVKTIDEGAGKAVIDLQISGKSYQGVQAQTIKQDLQGKSIKDVEAYFQNLPQVSRATIKIFPSFFKTIPADFSKIDLKIDFE